jgi:RHS repeat-associated protein
LIAYYEPDIVTAQDYYPFGMMSRIALPNNGVPYKFGFNGKMNDNDVKGLGNKIDYGARVYDPRIGRFLSTDPKASELPEGTPYGYADNSPIALLDVNGEEGEPGFTIRTVNGNINLKQPLTGGLSREDLERFVAERVNEINPKQPDPKWGDRLISGAKYLKHFANALQLALTVLSYETEAKPLFEKLGKDNYYEYTAATGFLGMSKHTQTVNNSFEIITSDPSNLPSWYVETVKERLMSGKAAVSDWLYKDELIKRGILSSKFGQTQELGKDPSSDVLGRNLEKAGFVRPHVAHAAHHIVAGTDRRAVAARRILTREGIDINEADNGIFLETSEHRRIHTNDYYDKLTRRLNAAQPGTVRKELNKIRNEIKAGTF